MIKIHALNKCISIKLCTYTIQNGAFRLWAMFNLMRRARHGAHDQFVNFLGDATQYARYY